MKSISLLCALLLGTTLLRAQTADAGEEFRSFKGANGKVIKAALLDKSDTKVTLLLENKRRAEVPLDSLSAEDQEYIKSWSKEKALFLQKCMNLTVRELLELRGYESFPFELKANSIIMDAKMNGKDAKFVIDTGAGTSLLHTKSAARCELEIGPMDQEVSGVSGSVPAAWCKVPTLSIGESVFRDRKILGTDLDANMPKGGAIAMHDGLFGADLLTQLDTVISYKENRIFFRPDKSDHSQLDGDAAKSADVGVEGEQKEKDEQLNFRIFKTRDGKSFRANIVSKTATVLTVKLISGKDMQVPVANLSDEDQKYSDSWTEASDIFLRYCGALKIEELLVLRKYNSFEYERRGNHIFVDGTLNHNKVTYMIDTGAASSLLDLTAAKENGCEVGPMDKKVYGIGGEAPAGETVMKKITLGKVELTNRRTLATDMRGRDGGHDPGYIGLFGADFMRELDAVITYKENRIFMIQR